MATDPLSEARDYLRMIAEHPGVSRNPDGVDQAIDEVQLIARDALARLDALPAPWQTTYESADGDTLTDGWFYPDATPTHDDGEDA